MQQKHPLIQIQILPGKGRAVIANLTIEKGRLIESAPTKCFSAEDREIMKKTSAFTHCFVRADEYKQGKPCRGFMVFGLSSLCNHSNHPNARIEWEARETGVWANLVSLRDIEAGEEITLYYTDIEEYPDFPILTAEKAESANRSSRSGVVDNV